MKFQEKVGICHKNSNIPTLDEEAFFLGRRVNYSKLSHDGEVHVTDMNP